MKREKFKSQYVTQSASKSFGVNMKTRTLEGAIVMQTGEARGHGVDIDGATLDAIVELGNAQEKGVKGRFGHPELCTDALGTYLGRWSNFRREGDLVRADLAIDETADESPTRPDQGTYVLGLSETSPDMLGCSVVVMAEYEYRVNPDGTRQRDENDDYLPPLLRPVTLEAVDIVDEPAATESMFSEGAEDVKLSRRTLAELRTAMQSKAWMAKVARILGMAPVAPADVETETAESGEQLEEAQINWSEISIESLKQNRPDLVTSLTAAVKEEHTAALSEAIEKATATERARCTKILSRAQDCHFAKTKEHPDGYAQSAVKEGTSVEDAYAGMFDLASKQTELAQRHDASDAVDVPNSAPADGGKPSASDMYSRIVAGMASK